MERLPFLTTPKAPAIPPPAVVRSKTTPQVLTADGDLALFNNIASGNTATGATALFSNTTGIDNMASGSEALFHNTAGSFNTANGFDALFSNTAGDHNTANGADGPFDDSPVVLA